MLLVLGVWLMFITIRLKRLLACLAIIIALLFFLSSALRLNAVTVFSSHDVKIPIVMYHHVSKDPALWCNYVVSPDELEADLKYLKENGYTTVTVSQLVEYAETDNALPEKPVVLTFDDGQESFYAYVYPLLMEYEMCAVLSIVGEYVDRYSAAEDHNLAYSCLNWEQVVELSLSGVVEIANHTYTMHTTYGQRSGATRNNGESLEAYEAALREDIGQFQQRILEQTGTAPVTFTFPFGFADEDSIGILKGLGFKAILTTEEKINETSKKDWIYDLGRFNRPHGVDTEEFFKGILT